MNHKTVTLPDFISKTVCFVQSTFVYHHIHSTYNMFLEGSYTAQHGLAHLLAAVHASAKVFTVSTNWITKLGVACSHSFH